MENPESMVERKAAERSKTFCVTGANGYIGSWLVKTLLERGYKVHATVRDPGKILSLFSMWTGCDRLKLFQADMQVEGSFDEAVKGCDGVFHVAASMEFDINVKDNIETYVQSNIINPAIKGTLNLLKACLKSESLKRFVLTSSISTLTAKDSSGKWRPVVDESCQTPTDHVWNTKASGWVYVLSKLLSEEAAFKFAIENNFDLVSVITTTVAGPFLTSSAPSSIQVLLSPITGESKFFSILSSVNSRMGSIGLVHIEDICDAHVFLMENPRAEGQYICCVKSCPMSELIDHLNLEYPSSNMQRIVVVLAFTERERGQFLVLAQCTPLSSSAPPGSLGCWPTKYLPADPAACLTGGALVILTVLSAGAPPIALDISYGSSSSQSFPDSIAAAM